MPELKEKEKRLTEIIRTAGQLAVAFSGGVDSSYLLNKAHGILGGKAFAVTVRSQVLTDEEFEETVLFCKSRGIRQEVVDVDVFAIGEFGNNPPDRCYHCKRKIFGMIKEAASRLGTDAVADGSNTDDEGDYRPGMRAVRELGILSPLKEAGLSKDDIRELSKQDGLSAWNAPSAACLASRFAYGEEITESGLRRVAGAERFIKGLGFRGIRVRVHGDLARIETAPEDMALMSEEKNREKISEELKRLGFKYVTMDMDGYRTGSMNEALNIDEVTT